MTALVNFYYGRQSKLTAQPYLMIIAWLLIPLSHTVQSVWNLLMFLKLVELIHLEFLLFFIFYFKFPSEHFPHQNCWSISDSVLHALLKASPVPLLNTRTTSLPRCVQINFCLPHILQAGRIQLAKVRHAKDGHILFDLQNLQNVSNYSSTKTIAPICLISPLAFVKHRFRGWLPKNAERHFLCTLLRLRRRQQVKAF